MRERRVEGHRLREIRERALLRRRELAAKVGCSEGYLRNIETAGDQPSDLTANKIAAALSKPGRKVRVEDFTSPIAKAVA